MKSADAVLRLGPLILVIQTRGNRMMRVVHFGDEIGERQLQLVRPQPSGVRLRREAVARAEEEQDVRGLADQVASVFEEWRCERREGNRVALHERKHPLFPAPGSRHVDVRRAGLLQREAHEFAAALDRWPVVELVAHERLLRG